MSRTIVVGCGVVFAVAVGCGGVSSNSSGTGGTAAGGTGIAGTGGGGGGAAGTGAGGTGTAGTGAAGTGAGGTGNVGAAVNLYSADALAFAAGQDGDGAWHQLSALPTANAYTLAVTGARYGLAYGCANAAGDSIGITVIQATVAETARVTVACGGQTTGTLVTVTGNVAGLTGTQTAQIDMGGRSASATVAMPAYSAMFRSGTFDLFARRFTAAPAFDKMIRRNAVAVGVATTFDFDFGTDGFAPEMRTVTIQGMDAGETSGVLVIFRDAGGSPFGLGSFPSGTYLAIPAAQLRTGDYHSVVAGVGDSANTEQRRVRRLFTAAMSFTAVMPALPAAPTIAAAATTPYLRPRGTIPAGLAADRYDLGYSQSDTAPARSRSWSLQLTRGWIASAGAADYTVPDLSAVTGFQAWWGLGAAVSTHWQQFANWSDAGVADLLRADQTTAELDGREYKITQRDGTITF